MQEATAHMARGGALKAKREQTDRVSGTAEAGGNKIRAVADRSLSEDLGDAAPDPKAKAVLAYSEKIDGRNKIELAEQIGQAILFGRTSGPRPGNVRTKLSGNIAETQYDTLYTVPKQETQATLKIARPKPNADKPANRPAAATSFETLAQTSEFFLQDGQETDAEKFQLVETFDLPRIYFSGRRARVWTYSGILMNTSNFQWKNRFLALYERYLRGTRCVEERARVYLIYDDVLREGYLLNATISPSVASLNTVAFSFTMFVTKARILVDVGDTETPEEQRSQSTVQQQRDDELSAVREDESTGGLSADEMRATRSAYPDEGETFNVDTGEIEKDATAFRKRQAV